MIRVLSLLLAGALALPAPAAALSCLRPDVRRAYQDAAKSSETYIIVLGQLAFNRLRIPKSDGTGKLLQDVQLPARLIGKALTRQGFSKPFERKITLNINCHGHWCANLSPDDTHLMFLRQVGQGYELDADPCTRFVFSNPDTETLRQARTCLAGGPCKPNRR
jgi:hypothetical protein